MKTICLFAVIVITGIIASGQTQRQVSAIAFYNFENLFDTTDDPKNAGDDEFLPSGPYRYTPEMYRQKLHNLASVIKQMSTTATPEGPAIIGTAEIENAQVLADLIRQPEIKDRGYQFLHFDSPDPRGIDVALLYHPGYFKAVSARALKTDISHGKKKGGRTRDVLYVHGILLGDTVHLFINHWPSRRGGEAASAELREAAASITKQKIDSLMSTNPETRVIVMGDLNDDPTNHSVAGVLEAKQDAGEVPINGIYNPFVSFYKRGVGTVAFDDRWNLFDQILLSGAFIHPGHQGPKFYKAEVFNRNFLKTQFGRYKGYPHRSFEGHRWTNGYSDHFPVLVYLVKEVR